MSDMFAEGLLLAQQNWALVGVLVTTVLLTLLLATLNRRRASKQEV